MSSSPTPFDFDARVTLSRSLHGHKYVLPVAAWIAESGAALVTASDVMAGLHGRADRLRVLEALKRLVDIGAMIEMPHPGGNAARYFQRVDDPYWLLVESHLRAKQAGTRK